MGGGFAGVQMLTGGPDPPLSDVGACILESEA